ncbi:hypothetical protein UFOVP791_16 [uncultured Caudovirales phage]|jgi:hypothetical protein|uniref:Uncharacterized protein n=1 Tax=uncultured Caudovirales phage TaxID=2100421 RepID=A0A6J5NSL2_9CAUD|nr:hypothetical protein UFOVP791_16 [uncultured Caudovirales phage]
MARTRKKVIDLDTYSKLDAYTIAINEYYKSLRRAGFAIDLALAIIAERSTYPDWLLPALPNKIDSIPYEDDEDE